MLVEFAGRSWFLLSAGASFHFCSMTVLTVLGFLSRWHSKRWQVVVPLLTYAVVMELLHLFIDDRSFEPVDMMQNLFGVAVGVSIMRYLDGPCPGVTSASGNSIELLAKVNSTNRGEPTLRDNA